MNSAIFEKALSSLALQFAWENDELFILDSEKITGVDLHIRGIVREHSLQLSVPLIEDPSPEQTSVLFWQEWMRRGEASFCMIDEEDGSTKILLVARLPLEEIDTKQLAAMLKASLYALARSYQKRSELFKDVERSIV